MKTAFFGGIQLLALLFGLHFFTLGQNQVRVEAENQHITVFLNRAQIDAKVKASVQSGNTKVIITNIASTVDPNSIQVGGKGDVVIMGVKFKHNYLGNKKRNLLEDSIRITRAEVETIDMLIKVADNERNMLMANASIKNEKDGVTPEDLKEMLDFFRTKLTEIGTRQMQLTKQLKEANDKLARLQSQLSSQGGNLNQPAGEIELTVSSKVNATIDINLSYIANAAGWSPVYDVRAKDTRSDIALAYRANVFQSTGIDWKNVKLTLSTSNPSEGGNKPELYAQNVSIFEPAPVSAAPSAKAMRMEAAAPVAQEVIELKEVAFASTADYVNAIQTTLAVNFDITMPYTVISGGNPELVDIQNFNLPATFKYYAVPKYDRDAFLTATITNWEKYNLLPGNANIYFEGTFVGTSFIGNNDTKDSLLISLGRDKKIITKRETVEAFKSRRNIGSNVRESFGFRITLRNTKSEPVTIVVEDQVPISQDSRIEVETEELQGADYNRETGKLMWRLTLQPLENKELTFKYNVKYPKGKNIQGL
jgi:uncharacterized protein (TIGR02231 family)